MLSQLFFSGPFLKSLLNMLQYCFSLTFFFFCLKAHVILGPQPETELTPPALEGDVLTDRWPGKSQTSKCFGFRCRLVMLWFLFSLDGLTPPKTPESGASDHKRCPPGRWNGYLLYLKFILEVFSKETPYFPFHERVLFVTPRFCDVWGS